MKTGIEKAVDLLKQGEVVAFPTETVYGMGADAWNPSAIKKVFEIKGRPADNPLIVHISARNIVEEFASEIPEEVEKLIEKFWPGPLTLVFKKKTEVLDLITAGLDTVALRWPSHPISQELIFRAGPLVAPSANKSGRPSPTKAEHVKEDFGENFPVIDGGTTQIGLESTVMDVSVKPYKIYRPGYIGKEEIEKILNEPVIIHKTEKEVTAKSPGTKYSHYAPKAAVQWLKNEEEINSGHTLYLLHNRTTTDAENIIQYDQNYDGMARELYDRFRQADHEDYQAILVESFPLDLVDRHPVVEALANRISKALHKNH